MDHIPLPRNCPFPPARIPFLDITPQDCGSWHTYLQRNGWQLTYSVKSFVLLRHSEGVQTKERTAFVQSWLYFGFLREFIGQPLDSRISFMQEVDGRQWVNTTHLDQILSQWTDRLFRKHKDGGGEEKVATLKELLGEHYKSSQRMKTRHMELGYHSILLSIAVLSERLKVAINTLLTLFGLAIELFGGSWRSLRPTTDLGLPIIHLLINRGWFPYDIGRIDRETREVSVLYYYSNLVAPRPETDHNSCSKERCFAMTTEPASYKPRHRHEDCECQMISADPDQVANILMQGSIPLISLSTDPGSGVSKAIVRPLRDGKDGQTFVAISHVWAEGAGNAYENALQGCMMEDMDSCVRQLAWQEDEIGFPFWIDTLCVPVRPPALKTLALNRMRVPYERAEHVLVLDSHLRSLESSNLSLAELIAQVSCSSWMRRLWTLQEGRLARRVWFQFADKAVDVRSLYEAQRSVSIVPTTDIWMADYQYNIMSINFWRRANTAECFSKVATGLIQTYLSLCSRSVSVPTDEALCLFTLLDLDITKVTAVPPQERMNVFWRTFNKVPSSLVFSRAPKKLLEPGLHWAPSSFMQGETMDLWLGPQELNYIKEDDPHAVPTNAGLLAALPGFLLRDKLAEGLNEFGFNFDHGVHFQDENGSWFSVVLLESWNQGSSVPGPYRQLAIVLANQRGDIFETTDSNRHPLGLFASRTQSLGVLVSCTRTERGVMYVTALNHVFVMALSEDYQKLCSGIIACLQGTNIPFPAQQSDSFVRERCRMAAQRLLSNQDTFDLHAAFARYRGRGDNYDDLLDFLLKAMLEGARCGDRFRVQRLPTSQQWCVD